MKSGEIKLFIGILIVALVLVGVAIYPMLVPPPKGPDYGPHRPDPKINRDLLVPSWAPMRGNVKAPYTLVEFGDYQCPTCATGQPKLDELVEAHKDKLNYVFHFMKVKPEHYNADMLAMAAAAAKEQGKFWEMHKLLMENQKALLTKDQVELANLLMNLANKLKLDPMNFRQALTSDKIREAVARSRHLGDDAKVKGTPTFFMISNADGKAVMTVNAGDELKKWLDKPENMPVPPLAAPAPK